MTFSDPDGRVRKPGGDSAGVAPAGAGAGLAMAPFFESALLILGGLLTIIGLAIIEDAGQISVPGQEGAGTVLPDRTTTPTATIVGPDGREVVNPDAIAIAIKSM